MGFCYQLLPGGRAVPDGCHSQEGRRLFGLVISTKWLRVQVEMTCGRDPGPSSTHCFRLAIAFMQLQAHLALPLLSHVRIQCLSSSQTVPQALKLVPFSVGKQDHPCQDPSTPHRTQQCCSGLHI